MADIDSDAVVPISEDSNLTDQTPIQSKAEEEEIEERPSENDPDDDAEKGDTCRICRSEGTEDEPLFYPCKCSGSIKFVHQDCLMEWLSHTNKKHCELCKTPFRFTKLYDSQMPDTLPFAIFVQRASLDTLRHVTLWLRGLLVGFVWLILLPWCIRWAWRGLFFMLDAGWAREPWIAKLEAEALQNATSGANATSITDVVKSAINGTSTAQETQELQGPIGFHLYMLVWNVVTAPWRTQSPSDHVSKPNTNPVGLAVRSSVFSDFEFVNSVTASPYLNKIVVDVLEGQLITFLVVVAFILVFLIREWVIQQQPILNAAAHVREAEQQLNRVDQARNRLRGDIQNAEEEIRHIDEQREERELDEQREGTGLDEQTEERELDEGREERELDEPDPTRYVATEEDIRRRLAELGSRDLGDPDVPNRSRRDGLDWRAFERRIRAASLVEPLVNPEHADPSSSTIRSLTDQLLELVQKARQSDDAATQTLFRFRVWVKTIPDDVDPRWLSQMLAAFEKLELDASQQNQQTENGGTNREDSIARPAMPPRGTTTQVNEILRSIVEEIEILGPDAGFSVILDPSESSSHTAESWQPVDASSQRSSSFQALSEQHRSEGDENSSFVETAQRSASPGRQEAEEREGSNADDVAPGSNDRATPQEDESVVGDPVLGAEIAARIGMHLHLARLGQQDVPVQEANNIIRRGNLLQRLSDWFWGDIQITEWNPDPDQVPAEDNAAVVLDPFEDVRFVGNQDAQPALQEGDLHLPADADPEVVAAAVEAGLDVEAAEEAEDLEGILELIGMQGPVVTLVQTAMFCGVLVTVTLWGAIGVPYLFGKLALLTIGDPILFVIILPLQIAANLGDIFIDVGLIFVAGIAWGFTRNIATYAAAVIPFVKPDHVKTVADVTWSAFDSATTHLSKMFVVEDTHDTIESGFLLVSIQAHKSLQELKADIGMVFEFLASSMVYTWQYCCDLSAGKFIGTVNTITPEAVRWLSDTIQWTKSFTQSLIGDNGLTMTVRAVRRVSIEPAEAYWSAGDRTLTVLLGYSFLALIGAGLLLRKEPYFTSETLRKIEKSFADVLRQAGGVLKVILIISIEMLAFPLYCGLLLDCALLPLFQGATFASRIDYASRSPYMFTFLHWFLGTAYMFNFALFVSMCRRILRSGVLYFIRDPDDPTFHPVRDVLERSVSSQLRKIAFSALVYGLLVILCLGGVIWGIDHAHKGVFPIRWSAPEPVLEFPLEFLFYNFLSPFLFKLIKPSSGLESVYELWLRHSARQLRLSHFLFGERYEDEEGQYVGNSWKDHVVVRMLAITRLPGVSDTCKPEDILRDGHDAVFHKSGNYVTAPASDQVRISRGQKVFEEVSEEEVTKSEKEQDCSLHGRANQKFRNVYVPPWFRLRIGLFLACLWTLSAAIGGGFTLVPLILGRGICSLVLAPNVRVNDIWSFAIGLHVELLIAYIAMKASAVMRQTRSKVSGFDFAPILNRIRRISWCAAKSTYVYGFGIVVIPATFALVFQLYLTLPLRTYVNSMVAANASNGLQSANATTIASVFSNTTEAVVGSTTPEQAWLSMHTIYVLPDWTLGFLYGKLLVRLMTLSPNSLPHVAWRQITRNGRFDPDIRLATRAFIFPTLLFSTLVLLGPLLLAGLINNLFLYPLIGHSLSEVARAKLYRYAYPLCASQALAVWCVREAVKATRRWRSKIKDEVYLIGERLHNFGEKRPPPGSKSFARRERH
ncbi:hypothetical protein MBLNU457_g0113t1 [Dothideomycetes sp. NU457]